MRVKRAFATQVVIDPSDAMRRMVYGVGALEACAATVGVSHQTLSKQLNEEEGNCLSLRRASAIELFMDSDLLAECFAARRGGLFIKLPVIQASDDAGIAGLLALYSRMVQEFSESSEAFSASMKDGRLDAVEVDRIKKEIRDLYTAGEQFVAAAEVLVRAKPG